MDPTVDGVASPRTGRVNGGQKAAATGNMMMGEIRSWLSNNVRAETILISHLDAVNKLPQKYPARTANPRSDQ